MLIDKVKETIRRYSLLSPGDRVVVAVSGGPDSVCLLAVLKELAGGMDLRLHAAHLDHMFRGEGSAADARFVAGFAERLGVPATVERSDVPAYCRERGLSSQAGAREVRYAFLERVAAAFGADRIATGHTADDQAETLLMRLLRGAGLAGLSGIPPKRGRIVRPLLGTTREEVLAFLAGQNLGHAVDPSNLEPRYTRNRIRLEVLPVLARFNPSVVETLAAEAALIRDEDEALDAFVRPQLGRVIADGDGRARIERDRFNCQLPGVRRRILRKAVELLGRDKAELSAVRTAEALAFMEHAQTGRAMELLAGIDLSRDYGTFLLSPRPMPQQLDTPLAVPGTTSLSGLPLFVETAVRDASAAAGGMGIGPEKGNYLWQAEFDYDNITGPLSVRSRRPGDRMRPAGMGGRSRKLQDLFTDLKVPRGERDRVPLLASGDDILWAPGVRLDERFLPGPGTKRVLVVTIKKNP